MHVDIISDRLPYLYKPEIDIYMYLNIENAKVWNKASAYTCRYVILNPRWSIVPLQLVLVLIYLRFLDPHSYLTGVSL